MLKNAGSGCIALSQMFTVSFDTITSPGSMRVSTTAFIDQESAIFMMGRMAHSAAATLLFAGTEKCSAMGEDEFLQEKPFLEKPIVCAAFAENTVFVSIRFGLELRRDTVCRRVSSKLGVRDLAPDFFSAISTADLQLYSVFCEGYDTVEAVSES